ncbi:MAG: HAD hydrolase family protein [Thermodesulfobacteriota bacterium]|nr:HAD hydrolase family protein [Thermodesulfobacteriota bacterium]
MKRKQYNTDCEGPISLNDNAYELAKYFIPDGDRFFSQISKYDDILTDIIRRSGYKAGDTLKLILPFLKAYGATNKNINEYCIRNIVIVPGADESLRYIRERMPIFIISTSYEQYLNALCDFIGFDMNFVYCTKLDIDKYQIDRSEIKRLKVIKKEIDKLPELNSTADIRRFDDLPDSVKNAVERLDSVFWEEMQYLNSKEMFKDINPIGGFEKANAIKDSLEYTGNTLKDVIYIGDSITDVQAFLLVKRGGGVTVSFNGNKYAVKEADIACICGHSIVLSMIADMFSREGKEIVMELAHNWSIDSIRDSCVDEALIEQLFYIYPKNLPTVEVIKEENKEAITRKSEAFREALRGKEIGSLG